MIVNSIVAIGGLAGMPALMHSPISVSGAVLFFIALPIAVIAVIAAIFYDFMQIREMYENRKNEQK